MFTTRKKLKHLETVLSALTERVAEMEDELFAQYMDPDNEGALSLKSRVINLEIQNKQVTKGRLDGIDLRVEAMENAYSNGRK